MITCRYSSGEAELYNSQVCECNGLVRSVMEISHRVKEFIEVAEE
ncbi:hypothetical protein ACVGWF_00305, partial [Enterobacter asburiae]